MSAIFGIIDFEGRPLKEEWIQSMQRGLAHRGPDGQGLYREPSVALGHMLLQVTPESIYDKSPYEEDGLVITADARLDEREAIMDRIGTPQSERDKITDPLLLLRSYKKFGKDFVKDIYGDFAFAIWDKNKRELFCARDQMGVKPFLYYYKDGRFVFSTEIKAIVKLELVNTEIDQIYLRDRTIRIRNKIDFTAWKEIMKLKPANLIFISADRCIIKQYWKPRYRRNKKYNSEDLVISDLRDLLSKVIDDHLSVNGKVGANLSGGLDSSSIVCIAAKKLAREGKSLTTVSSVYKPGFPDDEKQDEMDFVKEVLNSEQNLVGTFVYHSDLDFWDGLSQSIARQYSPPWIFYYVDEAIYKQFQISGVRRVLSGHGGDYTITNYSISPFVWLLFHGKVRKLLKLINKSRLHTGQSLINFIKSSILTEVIPSEIYKFYLKLRRKEFRKIFDLTKTPLIFKDSERIKLEKYITRKNEPCSRFNKDIAENIWPNEYELFEEENNCRSSYYNIELTYPLADRRLVEFLLQLPVEYFYINGIRRGLIRKLMEGILPEKIRKRSDKREYSPGHSLIIKKDLQKILNFLSDFELNSYLKNLVNPEKLKFDIEIFKNTKKNVIFDFRLLNLFEIIIWLYYNLEINKAISNEIYEKNKVGEAFH